VALFSRGHQKYLTAEVQAQCKTVVDLLQTSDGLDELESFLRYSSAITP
jgi:hypothetical protein